MARIEQRRANADDAASIAACAAEAFRHYIPRLGLTPIPMTRDYAAAIANAQVWVATLQGETIAALVLDVTDEGILIDVIAVMPQHQGTGVGRALLELAEREALRQGHDSIYLFTNEKMTENRALYERIGYVEYKRVAFAERTRVFLRKPLKPVEDLHALLLKLEGALHLREVRASAAQLEELLDDDFRELGVSGTEWTRPAIIEALRDEVFSQRTISDFRVQRMASDIALVTYRAHRAATAERPAADSLRSSLWRLRLGRWRMVFHQGTPL